MAQLRVEDVAEVQGQWAIEIREGEGQSLKNPGSARTVPIHSVLVGLGFLALQAINNRDYFLLQGIFLFVIVGVLVANFLIDIVYVIVDPRVRLGMETD